MPGSESIALSFEVGDIASAVKGIDDLASAMGRLGGASQVALSPALMPVHNPIEGLLTGLTALPGIAGKAALGIKAITTALDAVNTYLNNQAQQQLNFGVSQKLLATDPKTTAMLQTLGEAAGVNMESLANSLRANAMKTPGAAEATSKLGYPYVPEPLAMDTGKALLNDINRLRDLYKRDPAEALRLAKNQDPELVKFLALSDQAMATANASADVRKQYLTPEAEAKALERAINNATLNQAIREGHGPSIIPTARGAQERLQHQHESLKKNTQAVQENTEQLSKLNGIWGGGPRLRNAIPRAYQGRGDALEDALKNDRAKFGAFGVGQ